MHWIYDNLALILQCLETFSELHQKGITDTVEILLTPLVMKIPVICFRLIEF